MPLDLQRQFKAINVALCTVSDTRTLATDVSGDLLAERISKAGHNLVARVIRSDDLSGLVAQLKKWAEDPNIDAVLTTGGTGVTGRDSTPEALAAVAEKDIPGFGELFRAISFQKIGTSTIQSRACAAVGQGTYFFALPGSKGAVCDAWDEILVHQLDIRHRPCNFVELMPRLQEK